MRDKYDKVYAVSFAQRGRNMENRFYISVAGLTVEMNYIRPRMLRFCKDYLIDPPAEGADIVAATSPEKIEEEIKTSEDPVTKYSGEQLSLYRDIAENVPKFGAFLFHGASIAYEGNGYLFGALSGTGKTTHIKLWMQYLGEKVQIVNGDKPLLRVREDGVDVCATPWSGKERLHKNQIVPLKALCLLRRGETNRIEKVEAKDYMNLIMQQVYLPRNAKALNETFDLLDKMLRLVPVYVLYCDISEDAVRTSFTALTGLPYPGER